jgi:hypothetical protein
MLCQVLIVQTRLSSNIYAAQIQKPDGKYIYRHEWDTSIRNSHLDGPDRDILLNHLWEDIETIETAFNPFLDWANSNPPNEVSWI